MAHDSFELLSRSCVGPDEYFLKTIYVGLSVVALTCVSVMLTRVAWKRWRPGGRSSIGRLIEYLVWTQGQCSRPVCCNVTAAPDQSNDAGSSWGVCLPHGPNPKTSPPPPPHNK